MFDVERDFYKEDVITNLSAINIDENRLMNMQNINEKLLRLAVKITDYYATDILILLDCLEKYFLEQEVSEIDIYFRNTGIDWILDNRIDKQYIPDKYRGKAKLIFNSGKETVSLYWGRGNC